MNPLKWSSVAMLIAVAVLSNSAACSRNASSKSPLDVSANAAAAKGNAAEAEHDHFPAHWPSTIFVASERLVALQKSEGSPNSPQGVSPEQELIDLLRWLPELAADSDLEERTFNKIDTWSHDYLQMLEPKWNAGAKLDSLLAVEGLSKVIAELQEIVKTESERIALMQGKSIQEN